MSVPKSFRQMAGIPASQVNTSSGTTVLLVIDPQKSYAKGSPLEISQVETRQKVISGLVDTFHQGNAPVIWVQVRLPSRKGCNSTDFKDVYSTRLVVVRPSLIQIMKVLIGWT